MAEGDKRSIVGPPAPKEFVAGRLLAGVVRGAEIGTAIGRDSSIPTGEMMTGDTGLSGNGRTGVVNETVVGGDVSGPDDEDSAGSIVGAIAAAGPLEAAPPPLSATDAISDPAPRRTRGGAVEPPRAPRPGIRTAPEPGPIRSV
jgi:hypothetical protein